VPGSVALGSGIEQHDIGVGVAQLRQLWSQTGVLILAHEAAGGHANPTIAQRGQVLAREGRPERGKSPKAGEIGLVAGDADGAGHPPAGVEPVIVPVRGPGPLEAEPVDATQGPRRAAPQVLQRSG
jgi:hypothetical protein